MCHSLIRIVCQQCGSQIGKPELKKAQCLPIKSRPAWNSGVSLFEQHRVKRFRKTIPACDGCTTGVESCAGGVDDPVIRDEAGVQSHHQKIKDVKDAVQAGTRGRGP